MRISPRAFSAALLIATVSLPFSAHGQIVHYGNFAPGTLIAESVEGEGGETGETGVDEPTSISSSQAAAVSFTVGAQPIRVTSVDLALGFRFGDIGGFSLAITANDFPTTSPTLFTLSTSSIPGTPSRVSFTADAAVTLAANTTYYLQLTAEPGTGADWYQVLNDTPILSDYSVYNFGYGGNYAAFPDQDLYGYYITATTAVPEPGEVGLVFGGVLLAGAGVRAWRRQRGCAA